MNSRIVFILLLATGSLFAQKRVLLENYTSAFCGACPLGHLEAEYLAEAYPNVILAFHHSSVDGMANEHSTEWKQFYNVLYTPSAAVDRFEGGSETPMLPVTDWEGVVQQRLAEPSYVDIELSGSYDKTAREFSIDAGLTFSQHPPEGELRLNLMVVEDSVIHAGFGYDQSNYYNEAEGHPLYGLGQPIYFYPHNHVVRDMVEDTWGTDGLFPEEIVLGISYEHHYDYYVTWNWDHAYIRLIAFVTLYEEGDPNRQQVLNATEVKLFDLIPTSTASFERKHSPLFAYPNPASGQVRLELPDHTQQIELYNASGQQVFHKAWQESGRTLEMNIKPFSSGTYYLRAISRDGIQSIPLIIAP